MALLFGKKVRVGNFYVMKYNRTLSGSQLGELRKEYPAELLKGLGRAGIPMLKISTAAEDWSVSYAFTHTVFQYIDALADDDGNLSEDDELSLYNLVLLFFADTTIVPDREYFEGKQRLFHEMIERRSSKGVVTDPVESGAALDDVSDSEEVKDSLLDIIEEVKKDEGID